MVLDSYDRNANLTRTRTRSWQAITPQERLRRWHKRVMRKKRSKDQRCELPARIVSDQGLNDPWIILKTDGVVVHVATDTVITIPVHS